MIDNILAKDKRDYGPLIGALDQGTSSTRFIIFAANSGQIITQHQVELSKICPYDQWVEQDPMEILASVEECIIHAVAKLRLMNIDQNDVVGVGLCNQRETVVVWDRDNGQPLYNAVLWLDNRTCDLIESILNDIPGRDKTYFKSETGLPISGYSAAIKLQWLIDNVPAVSEALKNDRLMCGTIDSWLLWNLIGKHMTDVTNASRTLLMNLETLEWDPFLCKFFKIPMKILPQIKSSSEIYGKILNGPLKDVPICGVIGDQHAAIIGQNCLKKGQTKATYGTGCFIIQNIGFGSLSSVMKCVSIEAKKSLITTVAYKFGDEDPCYAIEGSVAIAGAAMTWLRDNVQMIKEYSEMESMVQEVPNSGGVFFVPAFQGLYAPHWDTHASGTIIGLSQYTKKAHIVRATLEAAAFQTNDILSLMPETESAGIFVDGGLSKSDTLCQLLADISGKRIVRPTMVESTALGAAMIAGRALGIWNINSDISSNDKFEPSNNMTDNNANSLPINLMRQIALSNKVVHQSNNDMFEPSIEEELREKKILSWKSAVKRSLEWVKIDKEEMRRITYKRLSTIPLGMFIMLSLGSVLMSHIRN